MSYFIRQVYCEWAVGPYENLDAAEKGKAELAELPPGEPWQILPAGDPIVGACRVYAPAAAKKALRGRG